MTLKLIKTNTLPKCNHCQGNNFTKAGKGWACLNCHTFVFPVLTNDIKNKRG